MKPGQLIVLGFLIIALSLSCVIAQDEDGTEGEDGEGMDGEGMDGGEMDGGMDGGMFGGMDGGMFGGMFGRMDGGMDGGEMDGEESDGEMMMPSKQPSGSFVKKSLPKRTKGGADEEDGGMDGEEEGDDGELDDGESQLSPLGDIYDRLMTKFDMGGGDEESATDDMYGIKKKGDEKPQGKKPTMTSEGGGGDDEEQADMGSDGEEGMTDVQNDDEYDESMPKGKPVAKVVTSLRGGGKVPQPTDRGGGGDEDEEADGDMGSDGEEDMSDVQNDDDSMPISVYRKNDAIAVTALMTGIKVPQPTDREDDMNMDEDINMEEDNEDIIDGKTEDLILKRTNKDDNIRTMMGGNPVIRGPPVAMESPIMKVNPAVLMNLGVDPTTAELPVYKNRGSQPNQRGSGQSQPDGVINLPALGKNDNRGSQPNYRGSGQIQPDGVINLLASGKNNNKDGDNTVMNTSGPKKIPRKKKLTSDKNNSVKNTNQNGAAVNKKRPVKTRKSNNMNSNKGNSRVNPKLKANKKNRQKNSKNRKKNVMGNKKSTRPGQVVSNVGKKLQSGSNPCLDPPRCENLNCTRTMASSTFFDGKGKLLAPPRTAVMGTACNMNYLFGNTKIQYSALQSSCCQYGMKPVNVKDAKTLECMAKAFPGKQRSSFLVRAVDESCKGVYRWCDMGSAVSSVLWAPNNPNSREACVSAELQPNNDKGALITVSCSAMYQFVCEGNSGISMLKGNSCPDKGYQCGDNSCSLTMKTSSYFSPSGKLLAPAREAITGTACGKTYVFGYLKVDYSSLQQTCCQYGMKAASPMSKEQMSCVAQAFKGKEASKFLVQAVGENCKGHRWCNDGSSVSSELWAPNNPSSLHSCATIELKPGLNKAEMYSAACSNVHNFICEQ